MRWDVKGVGVSVPLRAPFPAFLQNFNRGFLSAGNIFFALVQLEHKEVPVGCLEFQ